MPLISQPYPVFSAAFIATVVGVLLQTLTVVGLLAPGAVFAQSSFFGSNDTEFLPVDEALPFSYTTTASGVELFWNVAPDHYLYKGRVSVEAKHADVTVGQPAFSSPGTATEDEFFGEVTVFYDPVTATVPVELPAGMQEAELTVTYQGCANAGLCYPPQTREVLFYPGNNDGGTGSLANGTSAPSLSSAGAGADTSSATGLAGFLSEQSLWLVALVFVALGLGLTFTPCVLPMIPIISSLVSSRNTRSSGHALLLASSYVLGMALTYAAAGVITGLLGASFNLQAHLQSPWVLGTFAALFVAFALAMFNVYDLQMPAFLRDRISNASQTLTGGRLVSVFLIGALSALIVSPCVTAPLAGSLLYISTTQDALVGGVALFALGLGMGIPLIAVAVAGRRVLPTSGAWMNIVKAFYGVMLLAVAIWLIERLVPPWVAMTLWATLVGITGVQLGAFDSARPGWPRTWKGLGLIFSAYALALLVGALAGATDPLRPLDPLVRSTDRTGAAAQTHAEFQRFKEPDAIRRALAEARSQGQPVMLDFYADWCISCKVMERQVFSKPDVIEALEPLRLLQIDLTDNTPAQQAFLDDLGLFGPPAILFYDAAGAEDGAFRVLGEMDRAQFLAHLTETRAALGY
ncbi:protein-disulfide reductase DsbD [Marinobacter salicampi]|uniref:protein-disulfide reductase DsbD n=1 Tax=Marinobacter salicampi TaxID=435907 RepID=UPI0014078169|nr:protein-disulfide reductase DsbD [Marinobacter salicampi]